MAVTIKDVARVAGVSVATVTRALSTPEVVRPATRDRVREVAASLGYHPNRAARGLITGRTGNLGLLVPDLANPFFPGIVKGVQARAREADHAVFLADTDEDPAAEATLVRRLAKQVDGLVVCSPRMADAELRRLAGEVPMVLVYRRIPGIPSVTAGFLDGMRQAVGHLVALGHRRIAYVAGPKTSWANRERLRSLRAVVRTADVDLVEVGNVMPRFEGGVSAADRVLAASVTSVIAYNDLVAIGLLHRFAARGVPVPAGMSVLGFDDIPLAAMVHPALTTVALPQNRAGQAGVDLLLQLLDQPAPHTGPRRDQPAPHMGTHAGTRRELPTHLMVRGSTTSVH
ncbi:LacI family DNA-binding transcriptional regulator [Catenuloplanes japonicus]|uniref:LacI family DNA-binding transcriptional regulator n=1 Tax=Catenuloplanes japonicus TaxID=33876 RepID=UPI000527B934|nr:LacI family DNA-binding transcriptional regulator [Catenuloplanes japonicus]